MNFKHIKVSINLAKNITENRFHELGHAILLSKFNYEIKNINFSTNFGAWIEYYIPYTVNEDIKDSIIKCSGDISTLINFKKAYYPILSDNTDDKNILVNFTRLYVIYHNDIFKILEEVSKYTSNLDSFKLSIEDKEILDEYVLFKTKEINNKLYYKMNEKEFEEFSIFYYYICEYCFKLFKKIENDFITFINFYNSKLRIYKPTILLLENRISSIFKKNNLTKVHLNN